MKMIVAVAFLVLGFCWPAAAQVAPYVYPISLGTSQVQVLGQNPARKKLIFHNPNDTAMKRIYCRLIME